MHFDKHRQEALRRLAESGRIMNAALSGTGRALGERQHKAAVKFYHKGRPCQECREMSGVRMYAPHYPGQPETALCRECGDRHERQRKALRYRGLIEIPQPLTQEERDALKARERAALKARERRQTAFERQTASAQIAARGVTRLGHVPPSPVKAATQSRRGDDRRRVELAAHVRRCEEKAAAMVARGVPRELAEEHSGVSAARQLLADYVSKWS